MDLRELDVIEVLQLIDENLQLDKGFGIISSEYGYLWIDSIVDRSLLLAIQYDFRHERFCFNLNAFYINKAISDQRIDFNGLFYCYKDELFLNCNDYSAEIV